MRYMIKTKPTAIASDSRKVKAGALFLAYPGENVDGRDYIADAIEKGAGAILWEPEHFTWDAAWKVENSPVVNLKHHVGEIADQYYGSPSKKMRVIGVTGTNGKTSVTQWLGQCYNYLDSKAAVIGTLGNGLPNSLVPSLNTTPDALLLQEMMAEYVTQGVETVAMEVSSHGINQGRVNGVEFDIAVLTNLSRDHLDYHGSYEKYAAVKKRLFLKEALSHVVLNSDEPFGNEIGRALTERKVKVLTYGIESGDVRATKVSVANGRIQFYVTSRYGQSDINVNLVGYFNVYNVLAVLSTLLVSGVSLVDAVEAIAYIEPISGRMEKFGGNQLPLIVVDYAHTPDALKNVLQALRTEAKERLVCVFGCGGDRDQGKRAMMGQVASQLADGVVVTSDNPRNENPDEIIQGILAGMDGEYAVEEDRARAINIAIANAGANDVVLVAGKGHETYQEIADERRYFSDAEQVIKALKHYEVAVA